MKLQGRSGPPAACDVVAGKTLCDNAVRSVGPDNAFTGKVNRYTVVRGKLKTTGGNN